MSKEKRIYRLLQERPEYKEILERALDIEDNPPNEFVKNYGWEWSDVKAHPAKLIKLVTEGVVDIKYKSRRYTPINYQIKKRYEKY